MTRGRLQDAWQVAREAWPGVTVTEDEYVACVEARLNSARGEGAQAGGLLPPYPNDLYLACGCAKGDAAALRAFEKAYLPEIDAARCRVGASAGPLDDFRQVLREKLFLAEPGGRPKISEYGGRGELRSWVRVAALRTAVNIAVQRKRDLPVPGEALTFLIGSGEDPELDYMKRVYTEEFRVAFAEAFEGIDGRSRTLLRYAFGEGLTVDVIARLFDVHRATAARWVVRAHDSLVTAVQKTLKERLGVNGKEYASIIRLIESRLDITLDRYMRGETGT